MKVEDLVAGFVEAGLDEKAARAYVALARLGKTGAAEVAKAAGIKRPDAYRVLDELQARGLVDATVERPKRFSAAPAERALDLLREERARALAAVDARRDALVAGLAKVGKPVEDAGDKRFRVLQDTAQIVGQAVRAIESARKDVLFAASSRGLWLLEDDAVQKALESARRRGATVRAVVDVEAANRDTVESVAKHVDVRHAPVPRGLRFLLADDAVLAFVTADPVPGTPGREVALWVGPSDLAHAERRHFEDLWKRGAPLPERLAELATGRAPATAELVHGRIYRLEKLKEMALRAERALDVWMPADDVREVARLLAARAKEGLAVRVLTDGDATVRGADVRATDATAPTPFAVADGRELLLLVGSPKGRAGRSDAHERSVWSGMGAGGFEALFDAAWAAAR